MPLDKVPFSCNNAGLGATEYFIGAKKQQIGSLGQIPGDIGLPLKRESRRLS